MAEFFNPAKEIEKHRHNLPHWQQDDVWISVTWRLADSVPQSKLDQWKEQRDIWLAHHPQPWDAATEAAYHERFTREIEEWLDAGHGKCLLRKPANSRIVAEALHFFDGERYRLASYVVMPNHVHVLFSPAEHHQLAEILHSWKRHSSLLINQQENQTGTLWQADYWDRLVRSEEHFDWVVRYIAENPKHLPAGEFILWPG
jgi:REP element-mobilizing transposase RayT